MTYVIQPAIKEKKKQFSWLPTGLSIGQDTYFGGFSGSESEGWRTSLIESLRWTKSRRRGLRPRAVFGPVGGRTGGPPLKWVTSGRGDVMAFKLVDGVCRLALYDSEKKKVNTCRRKPGKYSNFLQLIPLSTLVMDVTVLLVDTDDVLFLLSLKVVMPTAGLPGPLCWVLTYGGDGEGDGRWTGLLPNAGVGSGECCWTKSGGGGRITCGTAGSKKKTNKTIENKPRYEFSPIFSFASMRV